MTDERRIEEERARRYRDFANVRDRDALHDALVRDPTLWDRDAPLTVVAAAWRAADDRRRTRRREAIAARRLPEAETDLSLDPLSILLAREELDEVRKALAELEPRDLHVLWLHAMGFSDDEVLQIWRHLGFAPREPTPEWLRKRRQRARERLRARLR